MTNRQASLLAAIALWAGHLPSALGALVYDITVDTSSLVGNPAAPFYIDLQFNDGSGGDNGDANNSARVDAVYYGGGAPVGGVTIYGGANGSLAQWTGGLNFVDSSPYNEAIQQFTPGGTLDFHVTLQTTNLDVGGAQDLFTFAILHSANPTLGPLSIPTTDPSYQLLTIAIMPTPAVSTFRVDTSNPETPPGIAAFRATVTAVPEPSVTMLGLALLGIRAATRRRPLPSR